MDNVWFVISTYALLFHGLQVSSTINLTATAYTQSFVSHDEFDGVSLYPDNYTRDWLISAQHENYTIMLEFIQCKLETGNDKGVCIRDVIDFYDGTDTNATLLQETCCGLQHDPVVLGTSGNIYITFSTDETIEDIGFRITYILLGAPTSTYPVTTVEIKNGNQAAQFQPSTDIEDQPRLFTIIAVVITSALILIIIAIFVFIYLNKNNQSRPALQSHHAPDPDTTGITPSKTKPRQQHPFRVSKHDDKDSQIIQLTPIMFMTDKESRKVTVSVDETTSSVENNVRKRADPVLFTKTKKDQPVCHAHNKCLKSTRDKLMLPETNLISSRWTMDNSQTKKQLRYEVISSLSDQENKMLQVAYNESENMNNILPRTTLYLGSHQKVDTSDKSGRGYEVKRSDSNPNIEHQAVSKLLSYSEIDTAEENLQKSYDLRSLAYYRPQSPKNEILKDGVTSEIGREIVNVIKEGKHQHSRKNPPSNANRRASVIDMMSTIDSPVLRKKFVLPPVDSPVLGKKFVLPPVETKRLSKFFNYSETYVAEESLQKSYDHRSLTYYRPQSPKNETIKDEIKPEISGEIVNGIKERKYQHIRKISSSNAPIKACVINMMSPIDSPVLGKKFVLPPVETEILSCDIESTDYAARETYSSGLRRLSVINFPVVTSAKFPNSSN